MRGNWKWEFDGNANNVKQNWEWECRYVNGRERELKNHSRSPLTANFIINNFKSKTKSSLIHPASVCSRRSCTLHWRRGTKLKAITQSVKDTLRKTVRLGIGKL